MANDGKVYLSTQIEMWGRYVGLASALLSVITSLMGNSVVAYISLGVLGVIVGEYCLRVILHKSPMQQAYHVLLPSSVVSGGELVYSYPSGQRRKAIIWLAVLTCLFLSVGGFNLWRALKPPVTPAGEDEILVLIVEFQSVVDTESKHDYPWLIYEKIKALEDTEGFRVEPPIYDVVIESSDAARELGHDVNATLVIWGRFDEDYVYPQYEIIKESEHITKIDLIPKLLSDDETKSDFTLRVEIPSSIEYLTKFTIGQVNYLSGEYEEAILFFGAAEEILHEIIKESNVRELESWNTLDWGEEYVYFYRGNTFAKLGFDHMALKNYEEAIKRKPKFAEAYNNLGVIWFMRGDESMALDNFNLAIENNSNLAYADFNRGIILYNQGNYDAAISDFSEAIAIEQLPLFYRVRADTYFCSQEYELARDDLTVAINYKEDDPEGQVRALTERGVVQKELGEYEKALKDFKQALKLDPDFGLAYYNMAATQAVMGKTDTAIEALNIAIQLNEDLEAAAACDPDFDNIRDEPQMPAFPLPPKGCKPLVCP